MGEWLSNLTAQFRMLPPGRRVALVSAAAGSLAFFLWLSVDAGRADYRLLFRGLAEDEALRVVEALDAEKIPYRLGEGGSGVFVPGGLVHEARIRVAGKGLPSGSSTGFEIFDGGRFGVTDFVQKVNFLRAVQGELARSIEQLDAVERARVQLAMPERSGFVRLQQPEASASVVVRLAPARTLTSEQARGIVHLVASSVQFLDTSRVTVIDTRGRMLAPLLDSEAGPGAPSGAMAQQAKLENELAQRVEAILERTVGIDRVVATVHAELDWTQSERTEETYDPDSQVARSEQRSSDVNQESDDAGGVPGVQANTGEVAPLSGPGRVATRSSETINYEISKVVSRRVDPIGTIRRLDVAVLVDGEVGAAGEDAETADGLSEAQLVQFEELAKRAVGFSDERGDAITVSAAPFQEIELVDPQGFALDLDPELWMLISTLLNYTGLVLAIVLFARLVGRPMIETLGRVTVQRQSPLPARVGDVEASLGDSDAQALAFEEPAPEKELTLVEQVGHMAGSRRNESVKALRGWLNQQG